MFMDLFAGIRDMVGGRSGDYQEELRKARELEFQELEAEAKDLGAKFLTFQRMTYSTDHRTGKLIIPPRQVFKTELDTALL